MTPASTNLDAKLSGAGAGITTSVIKVLSIAPPKAAESLGAQAAIHG
jgi:hypothetical protein